MATFVLVHGSFHAAWNWHRLTPLLEQAGHVGVAVDLPGHGRDPTPRRRVTLASCVDGVVAAVQAAAEPVVLVAHSRSGIVISEVAERLPDRVAGLVYLAAYLVPSGRSMMDYAVLDPGSLVVQNIVAPPPRRVLGWMVRWLKLAPARWAASRLLPARFATHALARRAYREALYHDCPPEIVRLAEALLEPEPNAPGFTPLALTEARFGRVPKVYVRCARDRAVTPALQDRMVQDTPCDAVLTLDTGHSPFFADPPGLAAALERSLAAFERSDQARCNIR
ncbi:MAG: alpha/beta fold hydrolase [Myxococcota bacterium]